MKLYSGPLSMFGAKAEIALREKKLPFELEMVAFSQAQGYQPRHPEVLRVNPKRQVPVLIDGTSKSSTPRRSSNTWSIGVRNRRCGPRHRRPAPGQGNSN